MEISTIVVGTDGSTTARRAVVVAAGLARLSGARLHVVHGYVDPAARARPVVSRWRESSESLLAQALADPALGDVETEGHSVVGSPVDAIVGVAERVGADLVVVGNRGMGPLGSGRDSVPDGVAHRAPCHVLIAKTT